MELDQEKKRLILSHRAVVEAEKQELKKQLLVDIESGSVLEGTVQRITDFGHSSILAVWTGLSIFHNSPMNMWRNRQTWLQKVRKVTVKVLSVDRDKRTDFPVHQGDSPWTME